MPKNIMVVADTQIWHSCYVIWVAYREGVVITKCKGCDANHMLADNLGWGAFHEGETNIEEYLKGKGMEASRVSPEVFDLEKVLGIDSNSGSLVGDDGTLVLEWEVRVVMCCAGIVGWDISNYGNNLQWKAEVDEYEQCIEEDLCVQLHLL